MNFESYFASFEKIIPLKSPSDLQDSTTMTAKLLTRSEGTIGELKTLLAAAATEAMRSGTELSVARQGMPGYNGP
jgi:hypothetical protein